MTVVNKSGVITLRNAGRTVRIESPVNTATLDDFLDCLRSALTGYFEPGTVIESIYFFEERT